MANVNGSASQSTRIEIAATNFAWLRRLAGLPGELNFFSDRTSCARLLRTRVPRTHKPRAR